MKIQIMNDNITPALFLELLRRGFEKHGIDRINRCSVYFNSRDKRELKFRAKLDDIISQESSEEELRDVRF